MLLKELELGGLAEALLLSVTVLDSVDAGHLSQAAQVTAQRLSSADSDMIMSLSRLGIKDCLAFKLIFYFFPCSPTSHWKILEGGKAWPSRGDKERAKRVPTHTRPMPLFLGFSAPLSVEAALQGIGAILGLTRTFQKVPGGEEGGLCLLAFNLGSVPDLGGLLFLRQPGGPSSQEDTILMLNSVRTPDRHSAPQPRTPGPKRSSRLSLPSS